MPYPTDPIFHAGITDCLPGDHPDAWDSLFCVGARSEHCTETRGVMVHAFNNETMVAWFETGKGPICVDCMIVILRECDGVLSDTYGLTVDAELPVRGG